MACDRRLIILVTAEIAAQANARAKELDAEGGERTFTVGLSATGAAPATHYWCNWGLTGSGDAAVRSRLGALVDAGSAKVFDGNSRAPESVLAEVGLRRIETGDVVRGA